ncbi:hypothetical protein BC941DRAFT_364263 [Chlamydoabsidia padenii]|nr:hypothetical protein BC941DRAFT_364263 [Chlamydoabsidia padenii]
MDPTTISLININGLNKQAISPLLAYATNSSLLLLTETWLQSPQKLNTNWQQFHTYGIKSPGSYVGKMGISLLIDPSCHHLVHHIQHLDNTMKDFVLSFTFANTLIHCVYLPPSLSPIDALTILHKLPLQHRATDNTIICGDFNARIEQLLGDNHTNIRGRLFEQ